jgi:hypothetical protein
MKTKVGECPNVIGYRRNEKFVAERWLFESHIGWGNHKDFGGGRSVMLPALRILFLLGFRKVYLLGCDMRMTEQYAYHFDEQRSKGAVNCNMSTYDRLKSEYLPSLKPYFEAEGFNVYNCNPDSELKVFPYLPFEDAIKDATKNLGNIPNERVWGMYSNNDENLKLKQEPPKEQKKHLETLKEMETKKVYEKPAISIPLISASVPPASMPLVEAEESNGCDDNELPKPIDTLITNNPLAKEANKIIGRGNMMIEQDIKAFKSLQPPIAPQNTKVEMMQINNVKNKPESIQTSTIMKEFQNNPIQWNPYNKVVQDHRNGTIDLTLTNHERAKRGLVIPWTPEISKKENQEPPIY